MGAAGGPQLPVCRTLGHPLGGGLGDPLPPVFIKIPGCHLIPMYSAISPLRRYVPRWSETVAPRERISSREGFRPGQHRRPHFAAFIPFLTRPFIIVFFLLIHFTTTKLFNQQLLSPIIEFLGSDDLPAEPPLLGVLSVGWTR